MRNIILVLLVVCCNYLLSAQSVDKLQATQAAWANHIRHFGDTREGSANNLNLMDTTKTEIVSFHNKAIMYKVQFDDGWALVSSELAAPPILIYSEHGTFPEYNDMSDGLKWFLEMYEYNLAYIRDSCRGQRIDSKWNTLMHIQDRAGLSVDSVVLDRMTLFKWGQTKNNDKHCSPSYNQTCPPKSIGICGHAPAGCEAVAMAGIMYYYKWPYATDVPDYMHSINSEIHFYDWDSMPESLHDSSTEYETFQVTQILRDCGKTINMIYGDSSSSSNSYNVNYSFGYFKYTSDLIYKSSYTSQQWISILKNEIDNGRPVKYSGKRVDSTGVYHGHAFIVMGYNSENQFRFNFGWKGTDNNTWLAFDSIVTSNGTYNRLQDAIIHIKPNPVCSDWYYYNDVYDEDFYKVVGGELTFTNVTIESGVTGIIYSGQGIHLTNGFHAKAGSHVHIAIKDFPNCNNSRSEENPIENINIETRKLPNIKIPIYTKDNFSLSPNPATNVINVESTEELSSITIYTLHGQPVLQTTDTEINVSSLSSGMYIVRALTTTGEQLQSKFIKQ